MLIKFIQKNRAPKKSQDSPKEEGKDEGVCGTRYQDAQ